MGFKAETLEKKDPYQKLIVTLSILIPVLVAALFGMPKIKGYDFSFLPPIYAAINGLTAVLLVSAVIAIKNGRKSTHERLMKICIGLSTLFLLMYVLYHVTSEKTIYGGDDAIKYIYYFILITHILLSVAVIPFVLFTLSRALI
jgi:putative membrane protein